MKNSYGDEELRKEIARKNRDALLKIMQIPEGRWLIMQLLDWSMYKGAAFTGNSQTFYNEGKRAMGIYLDQAMKQALGIEHFDLIQQAEKEYVTFQLRFRERFKNP